ncbi:lysosome membrane protein 2-like [Uloborus diversus]|uniref:lysosome membrane protein 2-like n=1 Tax=Uloborus diversus TaxID=327109 RepID=UPI00240953D7|nr:lysosome membrane protein 2-like [Uloborus diversus]
MLLGFFEDIIQFFLKRELVLKPGSEFYDIWKELPIPIYQRIFIFNITNPDEFSNGAKPKIQEIGPFVFRGRWLKEGMHWNETDGTVTYKDIKEYAFVRELSVGDQEQKIYTLNGPLLAVINYVEDYAPFFIRSLVADIMNGIFESYNETLLVHKTIREIIYEGYYEPMVADLTKVVEPFINLPLKLFNDTFGILHERKHIGDGVFTIKSGVHGIEDYAAIQMWNNQTSVNWWNDKFCDQINGTDGVQYAPGVQRNRTLSIFNPNLCRSMPIKYVKDVTVHGIKTLRFGMPDNTLSNAATNPENKCYCQGSHCLSGILPLNCKPGAPYVISFPHFLHGDPNLQAAVDGVNASLDKHKTYVDIEPNTGFVLNAAFRIQLNGVTRRSEDYKALQKVTDSIIPVLWMSEEAQLDVYFANYFKSRVETPIIVFKALTIAAVTIGAFWALSSVVFLLCIEAKVKPDKLKHSLVLKTLNSVYTSVALWPPVEDEIKEANITEKTHL